MVDRRTLRADALAALVGAIVVLPQGVAFATLAGMPPEYGLYCAMVPAVVAAFFGSSLHTVTGPTNAVSLIIFATVAPLAVPGSSQYVGLVLTLAFMSGLMMLALGLARLGALVNFISHTVVVGFTAGAAMLIVASQLRNFFGIEIARGLSFVETLRVFVTGLGGLQPYVLAVAATTLAAALIARRLAPRVPYMLVAMLAGGLLAYALNETLGTDRTAIRTLGALPGALPALSHPEFSGENFRKLLAIAVAVTVLGLTEAVSIARAIALKSGQRIDGNQEFIAQGLANVAASFFSGYPSSASFNRSGLNYEAGARTPLAAALSAVFLVLILLAVAPLVSYLPLPSMAAILFLVAWGLLDRASIGTIVRVSRPETMVLVLTFAATLLLDLEFAILVGVAASLIIYLNRTSQPRMVSIAPDRSFPSRKFAEVGLGRHECPHLKFVRIEGSIYFGAVSHVSAQLDALREETSGQRHLVIAAKGVRFVDIAGAELLAHEARVRAAAGGGLYFHGLRAEAAEILAREPFRSAIPASSIFATKDEAIRAIYARLDPAICAACPARVYRECEALAAAYEARDALGAVERGVDQGRR
jgi:SulP family sulfate permease